MKHVNIIHDKHDNVHRNNMNNTNNGTTNTNTDNDNDNDNDDNYRHPAAEAPRPSLLPDRAGTVWYTMLCYPILYYDIVLYSIV